MAFAGIFQPFARLRWIRFGLLMRDRKFSRRFFVPQTTVSPHPRHRDVANDEIEGALRDLAQALDAARNRRCLKTAEGKVIAENLPQIIAIFQGAKPAGPARALMDNGP